MSSNCLRFCTSNSHTSCLGESGEREGPWARLSSRIPYLLPFADGSLVYSGAGRAGVVGAGLLSPCPFLASYVGFLAMGGCLGINTDTEPKYAWGTASGRRCLERGAVTVKPDSAMQGVVHVKQKLPQEGCSGAWPV